MAVYKRTICDIQLYYQAALRLIGSPGNFTNEVFNTTEYRTCLNKVCYVFPGTLSKVTWNDAQAACEDMRGNLVSVNSDDEWRFLTASDFIRSDSLQLLYIGYHKVSHMSYF